MCGGRRGGRSPPQLAQGSPLVEVEVPRRLLLEPEPVVLRRLLEEVGRVLEHVGLVAVRLGLVACRLRLVLRLSLIRLVLLGESLEGGIRVERCWGRRQGLPLPDGLELRLVARIWLVVRLRLQLLIRLVARLP